MVGSSIGLYFGVMGTIETAHDIRYQRDVCRNGPNTIPICSQMFAMMTLEDFLCFHRSLTIFSAKSYCL